MGLLIGFKANSQINYKKCVTISKENIDADLMNKMFSVWAQHNTSHKTAQLHGDS